MNFWTSAPPARLKPYTAEEKARLQAAFAPVTARYRLLKVRILWCVGVFVVGGVLFAALPESFQNVAGVAIGLGMVANLGVLLVASVRMMNLLMCPGCAQNLERLGSYCPECGSPGLQPGGWFSSPHCPTCGAIMRRYKGQRRYTIRACSHCGLYLDAQGL